MAPTTLIVPGLHGSADGHWQSWWLRDHPDARLVEQDDWSNPRQDRWLAALEAAVFNHPRSILVAHSLGTILVARLAGSRVAGLVAGALLVAPADITRTQSLHQRTYEFGAMPQARLPFPSILVASRDDVYMSFQTARALGAAWGSELHDLGYAGHINIASGYGRWPEGYELARGLAGHAPQGVHQQASTGGARQ